MELNLMGIHFLDPISDHFLDREVYTIIDTWLDLPGDLHRRRVLASCFDELIAHVNDELIALAALESGK